MTKMGESKGRYKKYTEQWTVDRGEFFYAQCSFVATYRLQSVSLS